MNNQNKQNKQNKEIRELISKNTSYNFLNKIIVHALINIFKDDDKEF